MLLNQRHGSSEALPQQASGRCQQHLEGAATGAAMPLDMSASDIWKLRQ